MWSKETLELQTKVLDGASGPKTVLTSATLLRKQRTRGKSCSLFCSYTIIYRLIISVKSVNRRILTLSILEFYHFHLKYGNWRIYRCSFSFFIRDVRPKFECVLEKSQDDCLKAIKIGNAELLVVEGGWASHAIKNFNTIPIIAESYGPGSTDLGERAAVAVIKKSSSINKIGKK